MALSATLLTPFSATALDDRTETTGATILSWDFDGAAADEPGQWQGKAALGDDTLAPGPRAPRYPGFGDNNRAAFFPGKDAWIVVKDQEKGGPVDLRFGLGDSITIEAWIRLKPIPDGRDVYLVGKGRHGGLGEVPGNNMMNQNYGLRLKGTKDGRARLGFLFTSLDSARQGKREWHRWWSSQDDTTVGLAGWHHVALVFTFGEADSLRAYIDGKPLDGKWDLGGATDLPPVTDADDLVIGTGLMRKAEQSFSGWMDRLAIHRAALAPEVLQARYAYQPPPLSVTRDTIAKFPGRVLVQICEEGVPVARDWWPEEPRVTETHEQEVFGFVGLPQKYTSTGVRADRANPTLVRALAMVKLPRGRHRLLLRGRGAARLYIDGEKLLENPFPPGDTGGHGETSAQDDYLDLGPDFRFAPPGNRESWCRFESGGGEHFVVMETILGGVLGDSLMRPEFGETVVAFSAEGSESWQLLSPGEDRIAYTDAGWLDYAAERRLHLAEVNARARAARRAGHAAYWDRRRNAAKAWLDGTEEVAVPDLPKDYPAHNEIDHFIAAKIARVAADASATTDGGVDYFKQVKPLLENRCYDCHQGGKAKGELRLDRPADALAGGENDGPAVAPGDADGSSILFRIGEQAEDDIMPPKGDPLNAGEIALLTRWIEEGANWPEFEVSNFDLPALTDDLTFLRRASLDTVGVVPTEAEIEVFLADAADGRRARAIDRLLDDPRWADHWTGYWQDVLAENPNILNPTLNNSGPFRFWIYESLLDNKALDLMVTELIRMEGSERFGGPAGFATASQNDVPMAAKGIIVTSAFLGVETKCARCHDSSSFRQGDLFQLAAMMKRAPIEVPATSTVSAERFQKRGRKALIGISVKAGDTIEGAWPFAEFCTEESALVLAGDPGNPRDRLAALITAPQNQRFAQVMANRLWARLMGRGIVESVGDWERGDPSHPDLLTWLGRELVRSGYDAKHIARLILNSHAYQRATDLSLTATGPLYIAPAPRRLDAEQIVDGLFAAAGAPFELEEVSLDIDGVRAIKNSVSLGHPRRAWMLTSTSNERDRPSLSLPRIQAVCSVMEAFGWRGARQNPVNHRDTEINVLQPAVLANGVMGIWLTRLSDRHSVTALALEDQPLDRLIDRLFLRLLTRKPSAEEREVFTAILSEGYEARRIESGGSRAGEAAKRVRPRYVSWSNHLDGPANLLAQEKEAAARRGDPPSSRLDPAWRTRMEDALWALLNSSEWIYTP